VNRTANLARILATVILLSLVFFSKANSGTLIAIILFEFGFSIIWFLLDELKPILLSRYFFAWYLLSTFDALTIALGIYLTGITSPLVTLYISTVIISSLQKSKVRGLYVFIISNLIYNALFTLVFFSTIPYVNLFASQSSPPSAIAWIVSSLFLLIASYSSNEVTYKYVKETQKSQKAELAEKNKSFLRIKELEKYNDAMGNLTRNSIVASGNLKEAIKDISEKCVEVLGVTRVSLWQFNHDKTSLVALNIFDKETHNHSSGLRFFEKDIPQYFDYIQKERILVVYDALIDPATKELAKNYLETYDIKSKMDLPIWIGNNLSAVLSIEQVGVKKFWSSEEESFAGSIAILITTAMEAEQKNRAQFLEKLSKLEIAAANQMTISLIESPSLDESLKLIFDYILKNFSVELLSLFFRSETSPLISVYKIRGLGVPEDKMQYSKAISFEMESESIYSKALNRKKYSYFPRINESRIDNEKERIFVKRMGIKSILFLPIWVGNTNLGMFVAYSFRDHVRLNKNEVKLFSNLSYQIAGAIQKGKMLKETEQARLEIEKQNVEIAELNKLVKSLNEVSDIHIIMQKVLYYVKQRFNLDFFTLYITSKEKGKQIYREGIFPNFLTEEDQIKIREYQIPIYEGAHAIPVLQKKPFYISNVKNPRNKKSMTDFEVFVMEKCNLSSIILIPLLLQNEIIGLLDLSSYERMKLNKTDITKLSILGEQLAGIINASNLYKEIDLEKKRVENQKSEIEKLNEFTKKINESSNLDSILREIFDFILISMNLHSSWLLLIDPRTNEMYTAHYLSREEVSNQQAEFLDQFRVPFDQGSGTIYRSTQRKKPFLFKIDPELVKKYGYPSKLDQEIIETLELNFVLHVPLYVRKEAIGLICFNNYPGQEILKEDLHRLTGLCNQVAGAINNNRLFRDLKDRTQELDKTLSRIRMDLLMAKKIQENSLPGNKSFLPSLKIVPYYNPMSVVGGDFYDISILNPSIQRIFLADATGHGIQGAMITMAIKGIYDNLKNFELPLGSLMEILNDEFVSRYYSLNTFFTAILLDIDVENKKIRYTSAGHPAGILIHKKNHELLDRTGKLIGIQKNHLYETIEFDYFDSSRLYLFTDGIFEEFNQEEQEFGETRVHKSFLDNRNLSLEDSLQSVITDLDLFLGSIEKEDDITVLGIDLI